MKKNPAINALLHGTLWGIGVLATVGIGIISFNAINPTETTHGVSPTNDIYNEEIQQNISELQNNIETIKNDTTQTEAILQLKKELTALETQLSEMESTLSTTIPLGSFIASNGTISQLEMNNQGRALCDGTEITSQVPDAILKGTTLNLAGRTLVGEGIYAKDSNIYFQLGHVDQYSIGNDTMKGEVEHKLTFAEIPYHTHKVQRSLTAAGNNTHHISYGIGDGIGGESIESGPA
ncbi:MAG: hypothetical protein LBH96_00110 [Candidatus Peribacteria bacterium]|nr:hypothetical protein [Candidatus Peribacteria bacterium]